MNLTVIRTRQFNMRHITFGALLIFIYYHATIDIKRKSFDIKPRAVWHRYDRSHRIPHQATRCLEG